MISVPVMSDGIKSGVNWMRLNPRSMARATVRTISGIAISTDDDLVIIDVQGNAFLRNMVRILAGTLVEVGEGRRDPASMPELLAGGDRTAAGQTAPARGLTLVEVCY